MDNKTIGLVSLIVPVFNAEKYLSECIESIIGQSYENWELIVIDDGSEDSSPEICDIFAARDYRIKVLHKKNEGVSAARNLGLHMAQGEYIAFADADDLLPIDSLRARVMSMLDTDMTIGGHAVFEGEKEIRKTIPPIAKTWNNTDAIRNICVPGVLGYQGYIWNKLFRKSMIDKHHLRFSEGVAYNEDRLFCVEYSLRCERINLCNEVVYLYRQNPDGAMAATNGMLDKNAEKYLTEFTAYDKMINLVSDKHEDCKFLLNADAQGSAASLLRRTDKSQHILHNALRMKIWTYGIEALKAPNKVIRLKRKIKILGHMLLRK